MQDKTALEISDVLRQYIIALVKGVVLKGEPFEEHKKYLQRYGEAEGLDYNALESNLNHIFETIKEMEEHDSKAAEHLLEILAADCYLSKDEVEILIDHADRIKAKKMIGLQVQNGYGTCCYDNGDKYKGEWKDGKRDGHGTLFFANGDKFEGYFENGVINGHGIYYWTNGLRFEGVWKNGRRNGIGTVFLTNGDKETGEVVNDKREGEWILIKTDGTKLKATYENGKRIMNWH